MSALPFFEGREASIDVIHRGTAIYTVPEEIEALLDALGWPSPGSRILDPGAGNGGMLVAALARLDLAVNDVTGALRVHGYEFHAGALASARNRIMAYLASRGWAKWAQIEAALLVAEEVDFLLSPVPVGAYDVIAANPPYWRKLNLPAEYRAEYEMMVEPHAREDLLHAYLQRAADIVAPGGVIGLVTSDRWLLNDTTAELRRRLGARYTVRDLRRLDSASAFYRPKSRTKGTPARVHPVSLVLDPGEDGEPLTAAPFPLDGDRSAEGVPLGDLAKIQLAPWLGPDGIFTVKDRAGFPDAELVPVLEPEDLDLATASVKASRAWAFVTRPGEPPPDSVRAHLLRELERMPPRGRRHRTADWWLPPETFAHKLPLQVDSVLVPRIARRLTPIRLPAGMLPVNHNLVVVSGEPPERVIGWLNDPRVQAQADAISLRLENGYSSYTATLLRQLRVPFDLASA